MDSIPHLLARADPNRGCTLDTCPVSMSVYGYRANLPATLISLIIFSLSGLLYVYQGVKTKTWFFTGAMVCGCISEALGYVAKIILHKDPFSGLGFKMSVVLLTFAPAFYAAGIYYTLKHICLTFGANFSRLRPMLYTWIFISCDVFSIALQAAGGAVASIADDMTVLDIGTNLMIAGLVTQVFTLLVFGMLAADYGFAAYRNRTNLNPATQSLRETRKFKLFVVALWVAYTGVLIRCAYRVAELVGGWDRNEILRDEGLFIGLDSVPCLIASVVLNIWHPGWCFPKSYQDTKEVSQEKMGSADSSSSDEEARV